MTLSMVIPWSAFFLVVRIILPTGTGAELEHS